MVYEETAKGDRPVTKIPLPELRHYLHSAAEQVWKPYFARRPTLKEEGKLPKSNVVVLPVFVPGGLYGEDRERRMRMRYAVISALSTCGYRPKHSDRLSSIALPISVDGAGIGVSACETIRVPLEFYVGSITEGLYEDNKPGPTPKPELDCEPCDECAASSLKNSPPAPPKTPLLLLWIDESRLGSRPLGVLAQVLHHLLRTDSQCPPLTTAGSKPLCKASHCPQPQRCETELKASVRVIRPASSDMLLTMSYEDANEAAFTENKHNSEANPINACRDGKPLPRDHFNCGGYFADRVRIYSSRATISPTLIRHSNPLASDCKLMDFTRTGSTNSGVLVSRTVGTDLHLARAVSDELVLRGAWETKDNQKKTGNQHVVLISERDTKYGRAIVDNFKSVFGDQHLTAMAYLRGLDGKIARSDQPEKKSSEKTARDYTQTGRVLQDHVEPEGPSQLDYLHRLEQQLIALKNNLRQSGQGRITAIGVVGSDVFDKLIILRAIREEFPRTLFFTTDLDANFWRETEYPTTRNVIVASHYGLQLHPDLQRDVPPFRDSYQTSLFLTSLLAAKDRRTLDIVDHAARNNSWEMCAETATQARYLWSPDERKWSSMGPVGSLQPLVFEIGKSGPYQLTATGGRSGLKPLFAESGGWDQEKKSWKLGLQEYQHLSALVQPVSERERMSDDWGWGRFWWGAVAICVLLYWLRFSIQSLDLFFESTGIYTECTVRTWLDHENQTSRETQAKRYLEKHPEDKSSKVEIVKKISRGREGVWALVGGLVAILFLFLVVATIVDDQSAPDGEPFSWYQGLSVWPSTIFYFLATVASLGFLLKSSLDLKKNATRVKADLEERFEATHNLFPLEITARNAALSLGAATVALALIAWTLQPLHHWGEWWRLLCRGEASSTQANVWILLAFLTVVILSQYVMVEVHRCRQLIRKLRDDDIAGGSPSVEHAIVEMIARRTDDVGKALQYPFGMLLVLVLAQATVFDNWNPPAGLVITWTILLLSLFSSAWLMRRDAHKARQKLIRLLQVDAAKSATGKSKSTPGTDKTISVIQAEHRGAYCPWSEDYLLRALAIPLGGGSGFLLLQQWLL